MNDRIDTGRRGTGGCGLPGRGRLAALLVLAVLSVAEAGRAATITSNWLGGTGDDWNDPTEWSSNPLFPNNGGGDTFDVTFSSGSANLTTDITIDSLTQSGGAIDGAFDLTLDGFFDFTRGTHSGGGTTWANAGLEINGSFSKTFDGRDLVNAGTANHRGSTLSLRNGSTLTNTGTWIADSDPGAGGSGSTVSISSSGTGPNVFDNQGSFVQSGTQQTNMSAAFDNTGSVDVQAGTLSLNAGGTSTGGDFDVDGGTLRFAGGTHTLDAASTIDGAGDVHFSGGTVDHDGGYAITGETLVSGGTSNLGGGSGSTGDLTLTNGTLEIESGTFTASGFTDWTRGTLTGAGETRANGGLEINGSFSKTLGGHTLVNASTANHRGGTLTVRDGGTITNTGTWISDSDSGAGGSGSTVSISSSGTGPNVFENQGTFVQAGTQQTNVSTAFVDTGSVDVQAGTLSLNAGGTSTAGDFDVDGGTLRFAGGTFTLDAATGIDGAGNVHFSGATVDHDGGYAITGETLVSAGTTNLGGGSGSTGDLTLTNGTLEIESGTFTASGFTDWTRGTLTGAGETRANGGLEINGSFSKALDGHTLVNAGTANHRGGTLTVRDGATVTNTGTWISDSDSGAGGSGSTVSISSSGTGPNVFDNQGTFVQAGTQSTNVATAFQNSGTVEVHDGRLFLSGGLVQTAGTTLITGGEIETSGVVDIQGGTIEGAGLLDADLTVNGTLDPGVSAGLLAVDGALTLGTGAELSIEIGGLGLGIDYDSLDVTGAVILDGLLEVSFLGGFDATVTGADVFTIVDTDGILSGAFANVASGDRVTTLEGHSFQVDYGAASAFDPSSVVLSQFQSVPEPGTAVLLALGLSGLAIGGRRRPLRR